MVDCDFWRGRRVFITGHTGFKGGWLATWLLEMGAEVSGFALTPDTEPSYFAACRLQDRMRSTLGDVRSVRGLQRALGAANPEVLFHLAAQPLVRRSYRRPVETFATNVLGTAHLLEAVRHVPSVGAVVVVTSDKCYENHEAARPYREDDALGGHDPYSASKACAELVTAAYRRSFFAGAGRHVGVATARAGNVIGGGDWSEDRLVPDAVRAFHGGAPLLVRNQAARRPWQHVLEPLAGYLMLAERLFAGGPTWSAAWNFGPDDGDSISVGELADLLVERWGAGAWRPATPAPSEPYEEGRLPLDSAKARDVLGWRPVLRLPEAVTLTVAWYRRALAPAAESAVYELSREQIRAWMARARAAAIR